MSTPMVPGLPPMPPMPFSNPFSMTNSHEQEIEYNTGRRVNFILTDEAEEDFFYYNFKKDAVKPAFLLEGIPYKGPDGKTAGIYPMMSPNPEVPIESLFEDNPEALKNKLRDLFWPMNIYTLRYANFVGPSIKTRRGKNTPGLTFIDAMPPNYDGGGMTAMDMLWLKAKAATLANPAWEHFLPSRKDNQYRPGALPYSTIGYFTKLILFNWHGISEEDRWKAPDRAVTALRKSAFNSLIDLALTLNPHWDRSRVRTHADLFDPTNRPFAYDLVNAYGLSPVLTMHFTPGGGDNNQAYINNPKYNQKKKKQSGGKEEKGEITGAKYDIRIYMTEPLPNQAAPSPLPMAPSKDMKTYMDEAYVPPEKLFRYMTPTETIREILLASVDIQWSAFIEWCMQGTDVYSELTELFQNAQSIVANNVSRYTSGPEVNTVDTSPQQVFQPETVAAQQQQQQALMPHQQMQQMQQYAPPVMPGQQMPPVAPPAGVPPIMPQQQQPMQQPTGQTQQYMPDPQAAQFTQQPAPVVQQTQVASPLQTQPGQPAPQNVGFQPQGFDPASTMMPGSTLSPAEIEAQLRAAGTDAPPVPAMPTDPFSPMQYGGGMSQGNYGANPSVPPVDDLPF